MYQKKMTSGAARVDRIVRKPEAYRVLTSSDAKKVIRDTVSFYRRFARRRDVRGILEDLSRS